MTDVALLPLALPDAARVIGGYVWLEERLFEILGSWVQSVPEPQAKLRLAEDSHHHAWHASLWRDRLPALREMATDELVARAGPAVTQVVLALASAESTIDRLVGLYRVVLPRAVACYERHLELATPVTDGPTIRALQLVLADERPDVVGGDRLIQSLPHDAELAAVYQARLEDLLSNGGGGRESNPPDGDHPSQPL